MFFDGKKTLTVKYYDVFYIENVNKKILEDFSCQINEQMKEYLGKEILQNLTPNFTTTDYNSTIIYKLSIMGAFKKYFKYEMSLVGCGIPYIILEGDLEDYKSIKKKAQKLSKYDNRIYIGLDSIHSTTFIIENKDELSYFIGDPDDYNRAVIRKKKE